MPMTPEERRERFRRAAARRLYNAQNQNDRQQGVYSERDGYPVNNSGSSTEIDPGNNPGNSPGNNPRGSTGRNPARRGENKANGGGNANRNSGSGAPRADRRRKKKKSGGISAGRILILIAAVIIIILLIFGIKKLIGGGSGANGAADNGSASSDSTAASVAAEEEISASSGEKEGFFSRLFNRREKKDTADSGDQEGGNGGGPTEGTLSGEESSLAESLSIAESIAGAREDSISRARLLAAQYDYDAAIDLLKGAEGSENDTEITDLISSYEEIKSTLVEQDIQQITHVFFHILCVDPENAFDESRWGKQAEGYNSLMTTVEEFKKMMQEMYDKGYVLVSIKDLAAFTTDTNGRVTLEKGSIMLPPGKKAFVMSEDDVCYYEYMKGAGFADKMIVGEDGRPTLHYTDRDGNEFTGDYDLVGVLDTFIDEHPDFSYRGHKACLAFTGYNGVLGYRTDETYDPASELYDPDLETGHDVAAERREAVKVLKALHDDGYDLSSHSWGHRDLGTVEYERFTRDCDRWDKNVATLIEEATGEKPDIIIYPKGADIADWHGYSHDNSRFQYLFDLGFRYFCNVDSSQYWVQAGSDYLRQGRRALDGYNMWRDLDGSDRLSDLFDDVGAIFDPARPTPVPSY